MAFKKKTVVGVSVSLEKGLEVAQIDFLSKKVLKYGSRALTYDNNRKEIADLDIFKDTLADLFFELGIPNGSDIVLNFPAITYRVTDYPASLGEEQVQAAIEEDLLEHPILKEVECAISAVRLPNSTMQFHKVAYTALQKTMLIEIAMQIKELGHTLYAIDTSIGSTLNALIYNERVEVASDAPWMLLVVENSYARILSMVGSSYIDSFEERISIGEVLGDAENYSVVTDAVNSLLRNLPAQRLYVISKTDVISAKILAEQLEYKGQIIHQDVNCFATEPYLYADESIDPAVAKNMSLDVIGAAIYKDIERYVPVKFNLFNAYLGDVYLNEQPLVINFNSLSFVLSVERMLVLGLLIAAVIAGMVFVYSQVLGKQISEKEDKIAQTKASIAKIQKFLDENKSVSGDVFNPSEEIQMGVVHNKNVYSYYSIVGTEIPQKLWLTSLELGPHTTIEGQADNLESVYSFYRNVKDYNPQAGIQLQRLDLATKSNVSTLTTDDGFDTESIISSMEADFYSFRMSNGPEPVKKSANTEKTKKSKAGIPDLEPLE